MVDLNDIEMELRGARVVVRVADEVLVVDAFDLGLPRERERLVEAIARALEQARGEPVLGGTDRAELLRRILLKSTQQNGHAGKAANETRPKPVPASSLTVLDQWRKEGALIHDSTGIPQLDAMTGGGFTRGTRVYIIGAPDAGKTLLLLHLADKYLAHNFVVGLLAIDEEAGDIVQRLLQRRGFTREACERRERVDLDEMRKAVGDLPLFLYDASWSIEAAGNDLAAHSARLGKPAMFGIDSIQTARSSIEDKAGSMHQVVTTRVAGIRSLADEHRMVVASTSEMSRAAYRSVDAGDRVDDLAAAKESGAIEYSARALIAMRSVEGEKDLVELRVAKNKLGLRHRPDEPGIHLRLDRARQALAEAGDYDAPRPADARDAKRAARTRLRVLAAAAELVVLLAEKPGLSERGCEAQLRSRGGETSQLTIDAAKAMLGKGIVERSGPRRSILAYLDGQAIPAEVLNAVPVENRGAVQAARPPAAGDQQE